MSGVVGFLGGIPWLWVAIGAALGLWVLPRFGL